MIQSIYQAIKQLSSQQDLLVLYENIQDSPFYCFILLSALIERKKMAEYEDLRKKIYEKNKEKFDPKQRQILIEGCKKLGRDTSLLQKDYQEKTFRKAMERHAAYLPHVLKDEDTQSLSYFREKLAPVVNRCFDEKKGIEDYLTVSLEIHEQDIKREMKGLESFASSMDYQKEQWLTMKKPKQELGVKDGAVVVMNKNEHVLYKGQQDYKRYAHIVKQPYFLFVSLDDQDSFVGATGYKDAVISYTSAKARELRFVDQGATIADLLIKNGVYQKIYIRGEDENRYYDVSKTYERQKDDFLVDDFFEQESGLSEISHLLSSNQDMIFRSATKGTVLVEGVSGSGKTNLIFHRIDYLLQEYREKFNAARIAIITPNDILKAYMKASLEKTSFPFKDKIKLFTLEELTNQQKEKTEKREKKDSKRKNRREEKKQRELYESQIKAILSERQKQYAKERLLSREEKIVTCVAQIEKQRERATNRIERTHAMSDLECLSLLGRLIQNEDRDSTELKDMKKKVRECINKSCYKSYVSLDIDYPIREPLYHKANIFRELEERSEHMIEGHKEKLTKGLAPKEKAFSSSSVSEAIMSDIYEKEMSGKSAYKTFDYVLIDEFQDFSPVELLLLYRFYGDAMVLSGDFMQSLHYQAKESLTELGIELVDHKQMRDNFRNTLETVQFAHQIFKEEKQTLFLAQRVVKRGPSPSLLSPKNVSQGIQKRRDSLKKQETKAIIYHDKERALQIYAELGHKKEMIDCLFPSAFPEHHDVITNHYHETKTYMISYMESKGLEFDHVLLLDTEELLASKQISYPRKLYYIGCTRAVKTLTLIND